MTDYQRLDSTFDVSLGSREPSFYENRAPEILDVSHSITPSTGNMSASYIHDSEHTDDDGSSTYGSDEIPSPPSEQSEGDEGNISDNELPHRESVSRAVSGSPPRPSGRNSEQGWSDQGSTVGELTHLDDARGVRTSGGRFASSDNVNAESTTGNSVPAGPSMRQTLIPHTPAPTKNAGTIDDVNWMNPTASQFRYLPSASKRLIKSASKATSQIRPASSSDTTVRTNAVNVDALLKSVFDYQYKVQILEDQLHQYKHSDKKELAEENQRLKEQLSKAFTSIQELQISEDNWKRRALGSAKQSGPKEELQNYKGSLQKAEAHVAQLDHENRVLRQENHRLESSRRDDISEDDPHVQHGRPYSDDSQRLDLASDVALDQDLLEENHRLRDEVVRLRHCIADDQVHYEGQIRKLHSDFEFASAEMRPFDTSGGVVDQNVYEDLMTELRTKCGHLKSQVIELQNEVDQLRHCTDQQEQEFHRLDDELEAFERKTQDLETDLHQSEEARVQQVSKLRNDIEDSKSQLTLAHERIHNLERFEEAYRESVRRQEKLRASKETLEDEVGKMRKDREMFQNTIALRETEIKNLKEFDRSKDFEYYQLEIDVSKKECENLKSELEDRDAELSQLAELQSWVTSLVGDHPPTTELLVQRLEHWRTGHEEKAEFHEQELSKLRQSYEELKEEKQAVEETLQTAVNQVHQFQEERCEVDATVQDLRRNLEVLESECEKMSQDHVAALHEINQRHGETLWQVIELLSRLTGVTAPEPTVSISEQRVERLTVWVHDLLADSSRISSFKEKFETLQKDMTQKYRALEQTVEQKCADVAKIQKEMIRARQNYSGSLVKAHKLKQEVSDLKAQLAHKPLVLQPSRSSSREDPARPDAHGQKKGLSQEMMERRLQELQRLLDEEKEARNRDKQNAWDRLGQLQLENQELKKPRRKVENGCAGEARPK